MVTPRQKERRLSGAGDLDASRPDDLDLIRLQAQHGDLVEPAALPSILVSHTNTPRSSPIRSAQRNPRIDQLVFVDERMVLGPDGIEVARDDPTGATVLPQIASQNVQLLGTPLVCVERVEMHVQETYNRVRRSWGDDVDAEGIPPVHAGERYAADAVEQEARPSSLVQLPSSSPGGAEPLPGQQGHGSEWEVNESPSVLGVGRQEAGADCGVVEECLAGAKGDFLKKDDIRSWRRSIEDVLENTLAAGGGP